MGGKGKGKGKGSKGKGKSKGGKGKGKGKGSSEDRAARMWRSLTRAGSSEDRAMIVRQMIVKQIVKLLSSTTLPQPLRGDRFLPEPLEHSLPCQILKQILKQMIVKQILKHMLVNQMRLPLQSLASWATTAGIFLASLLLQSIARSPMRLLLQSIAS